jgi:hypothetical protein
MMRGRTTAGRNVIVDLRAVDDDDDELVVVVIGRACRS